MSEAAQTRALWDDASPRTVNYPKRPLLTHSRLLAIKSARASQAGPILKGLGKLYAVLTKVGEVGFIASFPADGLRVGSGSEFAHKLVPGLLQKALR